MLHKTDFKATTIKKDKNRHYIIRKDTMQQKDLTVLIMYAPNISAPRFINIVSQVFLQDVYRMHHSIFFSSVPRTCPKIVYMLGHKESLKKLKN